ncbi:MAG: anti-sigma factor, partial [Candidatus Tectomicrobia bacterium]
MNCHDIQEVLIDDLYNDLPVSARREVEVHCAACADCSRTWASLQAMHQALHQWTDVTPPPGLRARV